jgi:hypothetical protein
MLACTSRHPRTIAISKTGRKTPIVAVVVLAGMANWGAPNLIAIEIVVDKMITRSNVLTNGDMELIINLGGLG